MSEAPSPDRTPSPPEIKVESEDGEDANLSRLTFSNPTTTSILHLDDSSLSRDDEKKKSRKSLDDNAIRKRKDTGPSSFSSLIHRLTWGKFGSAGDAELKKDEKGKLDIDIEDRLSPEEDAKPVDRPENLQIPETGEFRTDFATALDNGTTVFWAADEVTSHRVMKPDIRSERNSELDQQENSLLALLDEFRAGRMRALDDKQEMKRAHEEITRLHLSLYHDEISGFDDEINSDIFSDAQENTEDQQYEAISAQLYKMHLGSASVL